MPTFFDLPAELRNSIYNMASDDDRDDVIDLKRKTHSSHQLGSSTLRALTQVNRQCRAEASAMYLSTHCFKIDGSIDEVFEWLDIIQNEQHTWETASQMQVLLHDLMIPNAETRRKQGVWETIVMQRTVQGKHIGVFVRDKCKSMGLEWCLAFASAQRLDELRSRMAPIESWFSWPGHVDARDYSRRNGVAVPTLEDVVRWGTPAQVEYARKHM